MRPDVIISDIRGTTEADVGTLLKVISEWEAPAPGTILVSGIDEVSVVKTGEIALAVLPISVETAEVVSALQLVSAGFDVQLGSKENYRPHSDAVIRERLEGRLSPKELEVLALICEGATNAEISFELRRSMNTVKTQVQSILTKAGIRNRAHAAALAARAGIAPTGTSVTLSNSRQPTDK